MCSYRNKGTAVLFCVSQRMGQSQNWRSCYCQIEEQELCGYYKVLLQYYSVLLRYYSVLERTTPVLQSTTTYYCSTTKCYNVLLRTTKYYSSTTPYYKVLLQYHSVLLQYYPVLQSTTPVLPCTTQYYHASHCYPSCCRHPSAIKVRYYWDSKTFQGYDSWMGDWLPRAIFLNFRVSFGYRSGYRSDPAYVFGKYSLFDETTIEYV